MNNFQLNEAFESKIFLLDLKICKIFLENDSRFPWIILVPMRNDIENILDLSSVDRGLFWKEVEFCSKIIKEYFKPYRLNIAMLGNITKQMHMHIVCRYKDDKLFPQLVWGTKSEEYEEDAIKKIKSDLKEMLNSDFL